MHGMRGERQGVCMAGGMHGRRGTYMAGGRGHAWQERRPLQLTVGILLECILITPMNFTNQMSLIRFNT